jgi:pyruvate dehydrogenase E2 component (dihydrolipoyllysine-residue acetyltransferase)
MSFTVTMPKLSPTMEEGQIAKWHKKEGDFVEAGETLLEVATDKATVEHEALDEGYLRKILIPEGGDASVNKPIAIFTETPDESFELPKEEAPPPPPPEEEKEEGPAPEKKPAPSMTQPSFTPEAPLEEYKFTPSPTGKIKASPLARKLAEEQGLDLSTITGSGPGGRIVEADLSRAQPQGPVAFDRHETPTLPPGSYHEEKLTPMRKIVGQRLQQSKSFVPHFYVTQEIDCEAMVSIRTQLKSQGVKVTFNDLVLRGVALALRQHPEINSGFNSETDQLIRFETIDISVAVSLEGGLITPIVRHADYKSVGAISTEVRDLATRAREGKLAPEEYLGGSFSISNLGMYGVSNFVAVINPPQAAILAISGIQEKPAIRKGQIVPGHQMSLTLSADHRVVDGADGARFLVTLKGLLEAPASLLL